MIHCHISCSSFYEVFCNSHTSSSSLLCFRRKYKSPLHLNVRPLKHNVGKETWKYFCGKISHHLFAVIQVILHGPSGVCRRTHFALFRWAITQKSLCLAQQRSTGLKISPQQSVMFLCACGISVRPLCLYVLLRRRIPMWWLQRDKCLVFRRIHDVDFVQRCPRFSTPLQSFFFDGQKDNYPRTNCQESLMLIDEIICARSALSCSRHR